MIDTIIQTITQAEGTISKITLFTKENPVIGGALALWLLGTTTYFTRSIPGNIWKFLKRHFTITMSINNSDELFYFLTRWLEEKGLAARSRTLKAHNGRHGYSKSEITAGYGHHWFYHEWKPFLLTISKGDNPGFGKEIREVLTITTFGRSQKFLRKIISELKEREEKSEGTKIYRWKKGEWAYSHRQPKRDLNSVFLPKSQKDKLLKTLKDFETSRDFYVSNGIPYHLGIALYGITGSGKTSLVKALCGHLDRHLYIMNLGSVSDESLQVALERADSQAIVLIEDADTYSAVKARQSVVKMEEERKKTESEDTKQEKSVGPLAPAESTEYLEVLTLSGILNAIDGVTSADGRILVMTTNDIKKLDPALLRRGRIDLDLELGCLVNDTFQSMLTRLYPSHSFPEIEFKKNVSPAELQALVLENRDDPDKVLKLVKKPKQYLPLTKTY